MMRESITHGGHTRLDINDPRWVFAMRARLSIDYEILDSEAMDRLIRQAQRIGLNPIQARAIIAIIEAATMRGGIDQVAQQQILSVSTDDAAEKDALSDRARWLTFGALFAWALLIAGVMQVVG